MRVVRISSLALAAVLLWSVPAGAEIPGFTVNKISGLEYLDGRLESRFTDSYQVNFADCLLYLGLEPGEPGGEVEGEAVEPSGVEHEPQAPDLVTQPEEDLVTEEELSESPDDSRSWPDHGDGGDEADDIVGVPRLLVRWSMTAPLLSSDLVHAIAVGSCSESADLTELATDTCVVIRSKSKLPGFSNNEISFDIRKLIGTQCEKGSTEAVSMYFFVEDANDTSIYSEVEVIEFELDYAPPSVPQNVTVTPGEENIKVAWEDTANTETVSYKVYWSEADFGPGALAGVKSKDGITAKSYQVTGLKVGSEYRLAVAALDAVGNESDLSPLLKSSPISVDDFWEHYQKSGGGEEGGFCFVATAAFGSALEPSVVTLRLFRDQVLLRSAWGRALVDWYYIQGPAAAALIRERPVLRFLARVALVPAVAAAHLAVGSTATMRWLLAAALLGLLWWRRRPAPALAQGPRSLGWLVLPLGLFAALAVPSQARADETPQTMAFEFRAGPYQPAIDSAFSGDVKPFEKIFGDDSAWLWGGEADIQLWHGFGSLGLFANASWGYLEGKGISESTDEVADTTTMSLVPVTGGLVYRFDVLAQRFNIPVVIAAKFGLDYTFWWIRDGLEEVTTFKGGDGSQRPGYGGTWGLFWAAALHLHLDFFEPHTAKVFDNEMGVNNSYLFAEYVGYWVDDFGSDSSFDLSHNGVVFGLAFEL